ncbi:hypothetical protein CGC20_3610 [Leishmania donovani]|uniref:Uncharacterized protein n=1 Tax=Leishmania donovani TaxID=5661 RepID=A0A504WXS5_LEIDO|nr:hypothetical protein CGC20_3610 [Leishmania donovani]
MHGHATGVSAELKTRDFRRAAPQQRMLSRKRIELVAVNLDLCPDEGERATSARGTKGSVHHSVGDAKRPAAWPWVLVADCWCGRAEGCAGAAPETLAGAAVPWWNGLMGAAPLVRRVQPTQVRVAPVEQRASGGRARGAPLGAWPGSMAGRLVLKLQG